MTLYLICGFIALINSLILRNAIHQFLLKGNMSRPNYRGDTIPLGMGILILISTVTASCFIVLFERENGSIFLFLMGIALTGYAGMIDDFLGNHFIKGLKGHLVELLLNKNVTTGGIKAVVGGIAAFLVAIPTSQGFLEWSIHFFTIALSINILNLFDVRPGRTLKVFVFLCILLLFIQGESQQEVFLIVLGAVLPLIHGDIKGTFMLGDVGSNVLGFTIGYSIVMIESIEIKFLFLLGFIVMQWIAEKSSISLIIEKYRILHYVDQWGTTKK